MVDITRFKDVIATVNAILNDGDIVEIKRERIGITVIRIKRKLEHPPKKN